MKQVYVNSLDIPTLQRFAVGFDRMFDELARTAGSLNATNYPPYNIIRRGETEYAIEVAVAGFEEKELEEKESEKKDEIKTIGNKELYKILSEQYPFIKELKEKLKLEL